MARLFMSYFYSWGLFCSLYFRSFLVLYADRGLVKNGEPNLTLFSQLYWTIFGSFAAMFFGIWPLGHVLKGKYILQDSNRGRACMLGNMTDNSFEEHSKLKFIGVAFNVLVVIRIIFLKVKVKTFVHGFCPKGKMSCLGNFRRNVITFNFSFWWMVWWIWVLMFCCISVDYCRSFLSVKAQFWMWNISEIIGCEGAHFVLPFLLKMPNQGTDPSGTIDFYVRKPVLEPRRPSDVFGCSPIPKLSLQDGGRSRFIYVRSR